MPCHDCNDPGKHDNCVEDCASWREHMKENTRLFFAEVVKGPMSMRLEEKETKFAEY
jgi:hypothetical protein